MGVPAEQCSSYQTPAGSAMYKFVFSVFLLTSGVLSVRQLRPQSEPREGKSLVNTFPFNSNIQHDHHNHHDDHVPGQALDARNQRQGSAERVPNFSEVAAARPDPNNDDTRCHTTYVTNYESQQEEECEENFRKNCFIDYE